MLAHRASALVDANPRKVLPSKIFRKKSHFLRYKHQVKNKSFPYVSLGTVTHGRANAIVWPAVWLDQVPGLGERIV